MTNFVVDYLSRTSWLPSLRSDFGHCSAVHIPYVYSTRYKIQQEFYAEAILNFIDNFTSLSRQEIYVVDGVVPTFRNSLIDDAIDELMGALVKDRDLLVTICSLLTSSRRKYPMLCIKNEEYFLRNGEISPSLCQDLFDEAGKAISINLINPFIEIAYLRINDLFGKDNEISLLRKKSSERCCFSYLKLFDDRLTYLKGRVHEGDYISELRRFCWNIGFLENGAGDGSEYEDIHYCNKVLSNLSIDIPAPTGITLDDIEVNTYASPPFDLCESIQNINYIESLIDVFYELRLQEEWRHYWQGRTMRFIRATCRNMGKPYHIGRKEFVDAF